MSASELLREAVRMGSAHGQWLRPLTENWPVAVCQLLARERVVIRVLVVDVRGSAPREPGTSMLVTSKGIQGTIGGGALEWHATRAARTLIGNAARATTRVQRLVLGPQLGQCCGGVVQLWMERFTRADLPLLRSVLRAVEENVPMVWVTKQQDGAVTRKLVRSAHLSATDGAQWDGPQIPALILRDADNALTLHERIDSVSPPVWIYGAGHVGQALVRALVDLPLRITWIDSRADVLPGELHDAIRVRHALRPVETVADAPPATRFVVLTHDHGLDYDLCRAILQRGDFAWLGLIGSKSKGAKFRARLARESMTPASIARLMCPMGVTGIDSKWPAAIAIAIAAQLLQTLAAAPTKHRLDAVAAVRDESDCSAQRCQTCTSHKGSAA